MLVLALPCHGILVGLGQLAFQVQASFGFLFQLDANRLQFNFDRVQGTLQRRTALQWERSIGNLIDACHHFYVTYAFFIFETAAEVIVLVADLVLQVDDVFVGDLQFLNFLGQLNVFLFDQRLTVSSCHAVWVTIS